MIQQYRFEELFHTEFTLLMKREIKQNLQVAIEAYNQFIIENKQLLSYPKRASVLGRWRTYMIERQIYLRAFRPEALYNVRLQETNNFGDKALFVETDSFSCNISRTLSPTLIPSASSYKLKAAEKNSGSDQQLGFDWIKEEISEICIPQYVLITYVFNNLSGKLSHLTYIVPDEKMKNILFHEDGMAIPEDVPTYTHEEKEESIVRLKQELRNKIGR